MQNETIQKLHTLIQSPKNSVVIGHKNPDGDAVGSCMAWGLFLKQLNHQVEVIMPNAYPEFLNWVPNQEQILIYSDEKQSAQKAIQNADLIFTLDFNHLSRVGEELQKDLETVDQPFVMIDHHQEPDTYAEVTISHPEYGSTAELVFECIDRLKATDLIDRDIASCLYLGIMTDTGSFKFPSTTARTHQIAAELIEKGAVAHQIQQQTFDANSHSRLKLLGQAMQNLEYLEDFGVAYIHLSQKELDDNHFRKGDTEGFVNYGLSIKNVVLAAIFKEDAQQKIIKISFRSKGNFDVNQFARQHFEGGGHKNAAGGKSELSLDATIKKFVSLLPDYKTELNAAL
ncbi:DHH family phosphoesterase [Flavobacteriaceae bacterium 14752]|uniref:DHH family phosphoesterase n=1 Tax=Mesohalobacter salilacus TaxID=2491711 RepID=UPI000F6300C3|nr:bifunctional oligoribonuclease/PAP phosphatase NrnA [Flavobacteriaceae bacterium 14752]